MWPGLELLFLLAVIFVLCVQSSLYPRNLPLRPWRICSSNKRICFTAHLQLSLIVGMICSINLISWIVLLLFGECNGFQESIFSDSFAVNMTRAALWHSYIMIIDIGSQTGQPFINFSPNRFILLPNSNLNPDKKIWPVPRDLHIRTPIISVKNSWPQNIHWA